jgi:regulator of replication initiation timing
LTDGIQHWPEEIIQHIRKMEERVQSLEKEVEDLKEKKGYPSSAKKIIEWKN